MAQNISLLNATYSSVPAVLLPKQGGGTARFDDCTVVTAAASDVASGKVFVASDGTITTGTASGGGGSSNFTLLETFAVGSISTTSTTATDTGKDLVVKGVYGYDLLVVEISVDTIVTSRHVATTRTVFLTCSSKINEPDGATLATATWNCRQSNTLTNATTRSGTTAYGIYPYDCTISSDNNGTATMNIYRRYNSTYTGTINGTYTARVYGVKLYDIIGG